AKMADTPEAFDVIVMPNLYGDILSDVAAQIAGSVGLAGSANIGTGAAMFEAIHGSAPRRAGQNLANPSGLFLGAILMLVYIGQNDVAELAHNAWMKTIEDGVHTYDIFREGTSKQKVGTKEFADAVVARLGQKPETLKSAKYAASQGATKTGTGSDLIVKDTVLEGIDIHVEWAPKTIGELAEKLQKLSPEGLELQMMSNRGVKVWPGGQVDSVSAEHFICRFVGKGGAAITQEKFVEALGAVAKTGMPIVQAMPLRKYDGVIGYSLAQGQ
ncbi:MAG: isocitrate/isopropylmalate family dehydrogenase, partial [Bryobacteraceae bacterium]